MSFTVTSFNTHWGGRRHDGLADYDLAAVSRALDGEVRIFQEVWSHPDEPSPLWLPSGFERCQVVQRRAARPAAFALDADRVGRVGEFALVLATSLPVRDRRVLELYRPPRDPRRHALACLVDSPLGEVWVVAVHLSIGLLPLGAALQLRSLLRQLDGDAPMVIAGDHNLWGPPARAVLGPRWRAAVRGRTWPAPRPRHQIDHIWLRGLDATDGRVHAPVGSDHCAVSATIVGTRAEFSRENLKSSAPRPMSSATNAHGRLPSDPCPPDPRCGAAVGESSFPR
jgi:endonuclease/exonuclease/phosphatase family metal-dependent hydrolase